MNRIAIFGLLGLTVLFSLIVVEGSCLAKGLTDDLGEYLRESDDAEAKVLQEKLLRFSIVELDQALSHLVPTGEAQKGLQLQKQIMVGGNRWDYSLFIPKDYTHQKRHSLVVLLHGTGFNGPGTLKRWVPRLGLHFIIVCPTMPRGEWWSREAEHLVTGILRELMLKYRVDTNKVFLGGLSSGGVGTFLIGLNHADLFAGLFPMSGAFPKALFPLLDNLETTPMYLLHGSKDQMVPPFLSRSVRDYMKEHQLNIRYREHTQEHPQAGGHFFPEEEAKPLLQWMKRQGRDLLPQTISLVHDRDHIGKHFWVRLKKVKDTPSFWASYGDRSEGKAIKEGHFARLQGEQKGSNQFEFTTERIGEFDILFFKEMLDFEKPITVVVNGTTRFKGLVSMDPMFFLEEARKWPDPKRSVWGMVSINLDREGIENRRN